MNPKNSHLGRPARRRLYYVFRMNREIEREIQRPGISLQPYLNRDARQLAEQMGFGSHRQPQLRTGFCSGVSVSAEVFGKIIF